MNELLYCPCGSQLSYKLCCQPFIEYQALPNIPEQLMRSRYTAYTQHNLIYIKHTMTGEAAANFDLATAHQHAKQVVWLGLTIVSSKFAPANKNIGFVEFKALYSDSVGEQQVLHERSKFERLLLKQNANSDQPQVRAGRCWYYVKGIML